MEGDNKQTATAIYACFLAKYDAVLGDLALPGKIRALHYGKVARKPDTNTIEFKGYRLDFKKFEQLTDNEIKDKTRVTQKELLLCIGEDGTIVRESKIMEIQKKHDEAMTDIMDHKFAYSKCKWNGRWEECEYLPSGIEAATYEELKMDDKEQKRIIEDLGTGERAYASEKEEPDAEQEKHRGI